MDLQDEAAGVASKRGEFGLAQPGGQGGDDERRGMDSRAERAQPGFVALELARRAVVIDLQLLGFDSVGAGFREEGRGLGGDRVRRGVVLGEGARVGRDAQREGNGALQRFELWPIDGGFDGEGLTILPADFRAEDDQPIEMPIGLLDGIVHRRSPIALPEVAALDQGDGGDG